MSFLLTSVLASKFGTNYVVARSDDANDAARPEPPMAAAESRGRSGERGETELWEVSTRKGRGKKVQNYARNIHTWINADAVGNVNK